MKDRFKYKFKLGVHDTPDWFAYEVTNVYIPDFSKCEVKILYDNVIYTAKKGDVIEKVGDLARVVF